MNKGSLPVLRLFKLASRGFVCGLSVIMNDMEGWFVGNQELYRFVVKTENCPKAKGADEAQIVGL